DARANIDVRFRSEVRAAHGELALEALDVHDGATGETRRVRSDALYIFIGADAETAWLPPEIALDERGYVLTGADVAAAGQWQLDRDPYLLETSVPGVFACGDVRYGPVKRVAAAVGEGSMAIAFVHQYLKEANGRSSPRWGIGRAGGSSDRQWVDPTRRRLVSGFVFAAFTVGACVLLAKHLTGTSWPLHRAHMGLVGAACALYFASYVFRAL